MADVVLKNSSGKDETYQGIDNVALLNTEGNIETFVSERLIQNQIQADWNQTDDTAVDYIKNKPQEVSDEEFLAWLNEASVVEFMVSATGAIYTTNNNEIYIL